jgi:hypothetical protein
MMKRWPLILVTLTLIFSMAACSAPDFPKAEESVNGFFTALGQADLETAASYCVSDLTSFKFTDPQEEKFVKLIVQKRSMEIVSSVEEGENGNC